MRRTQHRIAPALRQPAVPTENHVTSSHLWTSGTATVTVTDSTTKTQVASLSIPANQFAPGTTFEFVAYSTYDTTASPPTMQWEADLASQAANVTITPKASQTGGAVEFRGAATTLTDGTAGTFNISAMLSDAAGTQIAGAHVAGSAIDTTAAQTLAVYVKMTTAVASNSIHTYNVYVRQVS